MKAVMLPKMGLTMEEAKVLDWFKKEGDPVKVGEALLEIETEKANSDIESPANGYLKKIVVGRGETVSVESTLAYIAETEEELEGEMGTPLGDNSLGPAPGGERIQDMEFRTGSSGKDQEAYAGDKPEVRAAPAARKLARDLGIDLAKVTGSGPSGRILPDDVRKFAEQQNLSAADKKWEERRPMRLLLMRSLQTIPHINIAREVQADRLEKLKQNKGVTYTDILVKSLSQALREFPVFRSAIVDEKVVTSEAINIGLVVDTGEGVKIPVLKNADQKKLQEISRENKELARRARSNGLTHQDTQGATISISNLGMYGVDFFTAIIPYGQCAILTVSRIRRKWAITTEGERETPSLWLNLVVDHRLIDGAVAARLLDRMAGYLESDNLFNLTQE